MTIHTVRKFFGTLVSPLVWIANHIHLILFTAFLNNRDNLFGKALFFILPRNYYDMVTAELHVPKLWLKRIFTEMSYKSDIYQEVRHEKLIKAPEAPVYPASMRISVTAGDEVNAYRPYSSLYGNLITINDVVIDHEVKRAPYGLSHELIESFSSIIATAFDKQIFARFEPGSYEKSIMVAGIFYNKHVKEKESRDNHYIGGYIKTKIGSSDYEKATADDLKNALFHLPGGFRPRAKYYTHKDIGLEIATMKDGNDEYLISQRNDSLQSNGIPDRLLNKPIIYSEAFRINIDGDIVMMLADLSQAYTVVEPVSAILSFSLSNMPIMNANTKKYSLVFKMGGDVVHPEGIKVLKTESNDSYSKKKKLVEAEIKDEVEVGSDLISQ